VIIALCGIISNEFQLSDSWVDVAKIIALILGLCFAFCSGEAARVVFVLLFWR
jgi:hypothetical protein